MFGSIFFYKTYLANNNINNNKQPAQLIFIYNAKSGIINGIYDYAHKLLSPSTYSCNLCSITYDNLGKINKWSDYLRSLPYEITFLYKDHLNKQQLNFIYDGEDLPCLFFLNNNKYNLIISSAEMNNLKSLDELIHLIERKLP